jgi:hypothetical protein
VHVRRLHALDDGTLAKLLAMEATSDPPMASTITEWANFPIWPKDVRDDAEQSITRDDVCAQRLCRMAEQLAIDLSGEFAAVFGGCFARGRAGAVHAALKASGDEFLALRGQDTFASLDRIGPAYERSAARDCFQALAALRVRMEHLIDVVKGADSEPMPIEISLVAGGRTQGGHAWPPLLTELPALCERLLLIWCDEAHDVLSRAVGAPDTWEPIFETTVVSSSAQTLLVALYGHAKVRQHGSLSTHARRSHGERATRGADTLGARCACCERAGRTSSSSRRRLGWTWQRVTRAMKDRRRCACVS